MSMFSVAPFDQILRLNGTLLADTTKTLSELRILPKSTIYLIADEVDAGTSEGTSSWPEQDPEVGFKGNHFLSSLFQDV